MDRECAGEQQRAGHARPDLDREFETGLRRVERDEAERMVDEMRRDVDEKNEAGRQAQGPTHPAQFRSQSLAPQFDADGCSPSAGDPTTQSAAIPHGSAGSELAEQLRRAAPEPVVGHTGRQVQAVAALQGGGGVTTWVPCASMFNAALSIMDGPGAIR